MRKSSNRKLPCVSKRSVIIFAAAMICKRTCKCFFFSCIFFLHRPSRWKPNKTVLRFAGFKTKHFTNPGNLHHYQYRRSEVDSRKCWKYSYWVQSCFKLSSFFKGTLSSGLQFFFFNLLRLSLSFVHKMPHKHLLLSSFWILFYGHLCLALFASSLGTRKVKSVFVMWLLKP